MQQTRKGDMKYRYSDGEKEYGEIEESEIIRHMKEHRRSKHLVWDTSRQVWQPAENVIKNSRSRKRTAVLIAVAVLLVAVIVAVVSTLMQPTDLASVSYEWEGGVAALMREIGDNKITAKKKYHGTVFQLTGLVSDIDEDGLWISELRDSQYGVRCEFRLYRPTLESIKNDEIITVKGVMDLDGSDPAMNDCMIVTQEKEE
jgi:hypothetical protein